MGDWEERASAAVGGDGGGARVVEQSGVGDLGARITSVRRKHECCWRQSCLEPFDGLSSGTGLLLC